MMNYNTVKAYFESILIKNPTDKCEIAYNNEQVQIEETYEDKNYIGFAGRSVTRECTCRKCDQIITRFKQYKTSYTTIARVNSKNVILKLKSKMYYCSDCNSCTTERLLDRSGRNQKTDAFIDSMLGNLKETVSYSTVARMHKISVTNLILHFDKASLVETLIDRTKVRNLSVDEVRFAKQKYSNYQFVIMDADTKQILDILRTRQARDVEDFLKQNYNEIKTFTQDLWKPYKTAANKIFSDVKVITDRFHVVRQFMWAFSRTRIKLAKEQKQRTCRHWKILTKTRERLDDKGLSRLDQLLSENSSLRAAHEAKEMALKLFRCKDRSAYLNLLPKFKQFIDDAELVEFQKAYKSIVNWHDEILNMFDYPYSNGAMERANRTIKQSKNIAFGFRNLNRSTRLIQYRLN